MKDKIEYNVTTKIEKNKTFFSSLIKIADGSNIPLQAISNIENMNILQGTFGASDLIHVQSISQLTEKYGMKECIPGPADIYTSMIVFNETELSGVIIYDKFCQF